MQTAHFPFVYLALKHSKHYFTTKCPYFNFSATYIFLGIIVKHFNLSRILQVHSFGTRTMTNSRLSIQKFINSYILTQPANWSYLKKHSKLRSFQLLNSDDLQRHRFLRIKLMSKGFVKERPILFLIFWIGNKKKTYAPVLSQESEVQWF